MEPADHESLLIALLRRDATAAVPQRLVSSLTNEGFRTAFLSYAMANGVIGLALSTLRSIPAFGRLDDETRTAVLAQLTPYSRQSRLWDFERDRVLGAMSAAGFYPVVLKGAALRSLVYSNPVERLTCDLDLLVAPHRTHAAVECVRTAGYAVDWSEQAFEQHLRRGYHVSMKHSNGFVVELHWALAPVTAPFRFDVSKISRHAVPHQPTDGPPFLVPASGDMLLHLSCQVREKAFSQLKRVVDIDRVVAAAAAGHIDEIDWRRLSLDARAGGQGPTLALSLDLAREVLGTPIPDGFVRTLEVDRITRVHLALQRPTAFTLSRHAYVRSAAKRAMLLWTIVGWRNRVRWFRRFVANGSANPMVDLYAARNGKDARSMQASHWRRRLTALPLLAYHISMYASALTRSSRSRRTGETVRATREEKPWISPARRIS